jgi:hypothetical protein
MASLPTSKPASLVDITSLNGIESLYRGGVSDPWAQEIAGRFADLFVYSDAVRFTMPTEGGVAADVDRLPLPLILQRVLARDSDVVSPLFCDAHDSRLVATTHAETAFSGFEPWVRNNLTSIRRWIQLHREPWLERGHLQRVRPRFLFDINTFRSDQRLVQLATVAKVDTEDLLYAFDVVLRYPYYGELAGAGTHYLAHPIREQQPLPTMSFEDVEPPKVALSFAAVVAAMAPSMDLDDYTVFLHEARALIRERKIHSLKPRSLDRDAIRDVAATLGLPTRLKKLGAAFDIGAGVLSIVGIAPTWAPTAAGGRGAVSISKAFWAGQFGRTVGRVRWLRFALEWPLESQSSQLSST